MHNLNRSNSYSKIDIDLFKAHWPDQDVKMTPSPETLDSLAKGVIHIHNLGFVINNCSFASGVKWNSNFIEQLQEQLYSLSLYYINNPGIIPIDLLNIKFIAIAAGKSSMKNKLCGAGTIMECYAPNDKKYPCHLFFEAEKQSIRYTTIDFNDLNSITDSECKECILLPICPTCYGGNLITSGKLNKKDDYTCIITKNRAKAGSWMVGQMLIQQNKYKLFDNLNKEEIAMTVKVFL